MTGIAHDIVSKLWTLCNVLKDDGVTYHEYVTELTYLLFLKMAKETGAEEQIPVGHRWDDLVSQPKLNRLKSYKDTLLYLSQHGSTSVKEIFNNASSFIKKPATLSTIVEGINKLAWYNAGREDLGDIYEGLLEKNASDKKSGAGQYFTTRPLIDCIVEVMRPTIGDIIQDPAAGTGGFLIAANRYLCKHDNPNTWTKTKEKKYRTDTFFGMEHVLDTHRLALMNMLLHGLESSEGNAGIRYGDTLSPDGALLPKASLILSNPPFGTKRGGGVPTRPDLPFVTSNKQFCFLQHIYLGLKPGGRAAVIVPDNVLFENNIGKQIRKHLMDECNLHTILRLPTGIFYAQGVKTNVLFFTRGKKNTDSTKEVWVYDLRTGMPQFRKRNLLNRMHFTDFEVAFGDDPYGKPNSLASRVDTGDQGRFRRFTREWIAERNENLDISWLKEENDFYQDVIPEPIEIIQQAMGGLEIVFEELRGLLAELEEEVKV
jgi:type I restriction enzyme M protein